MFPQRSIYRPVSGMGEYFASMNGLGAYFKPQYEKPIAGLGGGCGCRGMGADAVVDNTVMTPQVSTANKTNAALLIGLGAAVIIVGVVFLGPQKMRANGRRRKSAKRRMAKRRPVRRAKRRSSGGGRAAKTYAYWAKITRRDLDAGYLTPSEVDESLRIQFDKDEGDYRRDGIKSASQFVKGVRAKL